MAFDFFTVPTVTFQLLYGFFVIEHGRRKVLHYNVTRHPTAEWVPLRSETTKPSFCSSPWILGAPQSGFSAARRRIRVRTCSVIFGRLLGEWDRQRQ